MCATKYEESNALRYAAALLHRDKPILVPYRSSVSHLYLELLTSKMRNDNPMYLNSMGTNTVLVQCHLLSWGADMDPATSLYHLKDH